MLRKFIIYLSISLLVFPNVFSSVTSRAKGYSSDHSLDLQEFPHPFVSIEGFVDCLIIVGDSSRGGDLVVARELEEYLKDHSKGGFIEVRMASEVEQYDLIGRNLLLVGGVEANYLTNEINDFLPIRFIKGKKIVYRESIYTALFPALHNSKSNFTYYPSDPFGSTIGVLELIVNPYNSLRHILVVAGLYMNGTIIASEALLNRTSISSESRNEFLGNALVTCLEADGSIRIHNPSLEIEPSSMVLQIEPNGTDVLALRISNGGCVSRMNITIKVEENTQLSIKLERKSYDNLQPGTSVSSRVEISVAPSLTRGIYNISIIVTGSCGLKRTLEMSIHVETPFLNLIKGTDQSTVFSGEGEFVISLTIENTGQTIAKTVNVSDTIPYWASVIEGSTSWVGDLDTSERKTVNYKLKVYEWAKAGHFRLGKAKATYRDIDNRTYSAESNDLIMHVKREPEIFAELLIEPTTARVGDRGTITIIVQNMAGVPIAVNTTLRLPPELRVTKLWPSEGYAIQGGVSWYQGWLETDSVFAAKLEFQTEGAIWGVFQQLQSLEANINYKRQEWVDGQWRWVNGTSMLTRSFSIEPKNYVPYPYIIGSVSFIIGLSSLLLPRRKSIRTFLKKSRKRIEEKTKKVLGKGNKK